MSAETAHAENPEKHADEPAGLQLVVAPYERTVTADNPREVLQTLNKVDGIYTEDGEFKPSLWAVELMTAALDGNEDALSHLRELGDEFADFIEEHADSPETHELFEKVLAALHTHKDGDTVELMIEGESLEDAEQIVRQGGRVTPDTVEFEILANKPNPAKAHHQRTRRLLGKIHPRFGH